MPRLPEIGNVKLYPDRPLKASDRNGYVLKFYCPIRRTRIRKSYGTRDRREARRVLREYVTSHGRWFPRYDAGPSNTVFKRRSPRVAD